MANAAAETSWTPDTAGDFWIRATAYNGDQVVGNKALAMHVNDRAEVAAAAATSPR